VNTGSPQGRAYGLLSSPGLVGVEKQSCLVGKDLLWVDYRLLIRELIF